MPAIFVINTDPSNKPGSHWIAFYFPKYGSSEFFDSYGRDTKNKFFLKMLSLYSPTYKVNRRRLQGDFSTCCGHYCCLFLYYRINAESLREFIGNFTMNTFDFNDLLVVEMYKNISKSYKQYGAGGGKHITESVKTQVCRPERKQKRV